MFIFTKKRIYNTNKNDIKIYMINKYTAKQFGNMYITIKNISLKEKHVKNI